MLIHSQTPSPQLLFGAKKKNQDLSALTDGQKGLLEILEREQNVGKRLTSYLQQYDHSYHIDDKPAHTQDPYRAVLAARIEKDLAAVLKNPKTKLSYQSYESMMRLKQLPPGVKEKLAGIDSRTLSRVEPQPATDDFTRLEQEAQAAQARSAANDWWPSDADQAIIARYEAEKKRQGW